MTEEPTVIIVTRCVLPTCHLLRFFTLMVQEIIHLMELRLHPCQLVNMASSHYPLGHKSPWRGVINESLVKPGGMAVPGAL